MGPSTIMKLNESGQSMRPKMGRRGRSAAFAVLGLLVAGCPSAVPYQEPTAEKTPGDGAAADELDDAPPFEVDPDALSQLDAAPEPEPESEPEPETTPPITSGREPWRTAESESPSSSETPELFANTSEPDEPVDTEPADEAEPADGFGSLLADEYADVQVANRDNENATPRAEEDGGRYANRDEEPPAEADDQFAQAYASLLGVSPQPVPVPPVVTEPEPEPEPEIVAFPADPPAEPAETGGSLLPFGNDEPEPMTEPIVDASVDLADPPSPLDDIGTPDDPAEMPSPPVADVIEVPVGAPPSDFEPTEPAIDRVAEQPDTPALPFEEMSPGTTDVVESAEPPTPAEPAEPTAVASLTPDLAVEIDAPEPTAETIDPLPEVPVIAINTKHLAWLLGAKLGLAELADLDGATPAETAAWAEEVDRLSRELGVARPTSTSKTAPPATRVSELIQSAAATGSELALRHGVDHAALLEIALKTNALLVIDSERPKVAKVVHDAVELAATKAMLPSFVWADAVDRMAESADAAETLEAVSDLHEKVERFLR